MPLAAALIGYVTKIVAIRMMFQPLEFHGVGRLGWQGIIPRRAARMASIATETLTRELIDPQQIISRLDPVRIAEEMRQPLLDTVDDITREVASTYQPGLWESLPEAARRMLIRRVQDDAPALVEQVVGDIRRNVENVLDIKSMIVTNLVRDKELLNRIFREAGDQEFRFIARSGIVFGFLIGLVQVAAWALTHNPLVMPLFGIFTGWFTDWLALKMIFHPKHPTRYLGIIEWQGLFLKRRQEVSEKYGALIAQEILTPSNLFEALLKGPLSDRVFAMVQRHVQQIVDSQSGLARPLVVLTVGSTRYQEMKRFVATRVMAELPETMRHVEAYAEEALDIRNTLTTKMRDLEPEEFEELLRPAFRQDEWILISVGAILGGLMGELQVLLLTH
ncbi:MAG: DUF445 family protein [Propionibacteriales bacterium]|nr:DUF445 family protein [Propionibacteriales bacterium]